MKKFFGFFGRHKVLTFFIIAGVVISILVGTSVSKMQTALQQMTTAPTTVLEKTDLEQVVTATGTLQSVESRNIYCLAGAGVPVREVLVKEGDYVTEGQLLVQLDTTDIDRNIADASAQLQSAQQSRELSIQQAQRKVTDAQNQYNLDKKKQDAAVTAAQAALDAAKAAVDTDPRVSAAKAALDNAALNGTPEEIAAAQINYDATRAAVEAELTAQPSAALSAAQQTRDAVLRQDSLAVEACKDAVNSLTVNDTTAALRTQLQSYRTMREKYFIRATMSGTVTQLSAKPTELLNSAVPVAVVQDLEHLQANISVSDYAMLTLKTGMSASLYSEADAADEHTAKVEKVALVADMTGNYPVTLRLTDTARNLHVGQSVTVRIVVNSRSSIFAVPYDAVTINEQGQDVILVCTGEKDEAGAAVTREVPVTMGIEGDYLVEIISDELEEGMEILSDPDNKNAVISLADLMNNGGRL